MGGRNRLPPSPSRVARLPARRGREIIRCAVLNRMCNSGNCTAPVPLPWEVLMNTPAWRDRRWWVLLLGLAALTAIPSVPARQAAPQPFQSELKWQPLFQGVDYAPLSAKEPRLMRGHAVRIDLTAPVIAFLATPPMPGKPDRTTGLKTSTFLTTHRCQVAINGAPFSPVRKEEGQEQEVVGLQVSQGKV